MEIAANDFKPRKPPVLTSTAARVQPGRIKMGEAKAQNPKPGYKNHITDWRPPGPCSTAVRTDQIKVWEMKKPHPPLLWMPDYPKRHHANGPGPEIPLGAFRPGPECVGQLAEFNERRVRCLQ
jgi:hypothetical protein